MRKLLVLLLLLNGVFVMAKPYCADSRGFKYDFGRYIFDGCKEIQVSFPFFKVCSEKTEKYLEENRFTYQLSDTFKQLKKYCSEPYVKPEISVYNEFENLGITFGRVYRQCRDFEQYCNQRENELFGKGSLNIPKEGLIKIFRKLKRNKPTTLCKITSSASKSSITMGPTVIEETLATDINISLVCEKTDSSHITCSFVDSDGNNVETISIQADIKDFDVLNKQIKKEQNKKEIQFEQERKAREKECPNLYRTLYWAQQGGYLDPIVGARTAKRFDELDCGFWLNQQMY